MKFLGDWIKNLKLEISDEALEFLDHLNQLEYNKVKNKLIYLRDNYEILKNSKNITALVNFSNLYRYKISYSLRAIFKIKYDQITILVLKISHRKDAYK